MSTDRTLRKKIKKLKRAPWVGAEEKWRRGEGDIPPAYRTGTSDSPMSRAATSEAKLLQGLELSDMELQTVQTLFPDPPASGKQRRAALVTKLMGAAVVMAVVSVGFWVVLSNNFSGGYASAAPWPLREETDTPFAAAFPMTLSVSPLSEADISAASVAPWAEQSMDFEMIKPVDNGPYGREGVAAAGAPEMTPAVDVPTVFETSSDGAVSAVELDATTAGDAEGAVAVSEPMATNAVPGNAGDAETPAMKGLNTLLTADVTPETPAVTPQSAIPDRPSKDAVRSAMKLAAPQIKKCRAIASGKLIVKLVVAGDTGRVVSSQVVDDTFRGTSTGLCAARVVSNIKLPMFQKEKLIIKYPFIL